MKPFAQGYRKITNPFVRERVNSAFANLKEPASAVSNLLQGEPKASGINLSRLVINTTLGLAVHLMWQRVGFDTAQNHIQRNHGQQ